MIRKTYPVTASTPGMKRIIAALEEFGPMTEAQIAEAAALTVHTTHRRYLPEARKLKLIRITHYIRQARGYAIPFYWIGSEPDALRPFNLTASEKCRHWRIRRGIQQPTAHLRRIDPVLTALMGIA